MDNRRNFGCKLRYNKYFPSKVPQLAKTTDKNHKIQIQELSVFFLKNQPNSVDSLPSMSTRKYTKLTRRYICLIIKPLYLLEYFNSDGMFEAYSCYEMYVNDFYKHYLTIIGHLLNKCTNILNIYFNT